MRILHVLDASANWQHRVALTQLFDKLPENDVRLHVASIDPRPNTVIRQLPATTIETAPRRLGLGALAAPALRRLCGREGVDIVHAWGADAAAAARAARPDGPLVLTVFDPGVSPRDVRVIRTVAQDHPFAVACASQRVRRRLVEQGVPLDRCAVIRPAVDFAAISRDRKSLTRRQLELPDDALVVIAPEPETHRDAYGQLSVLWSVLVRSHLPGPVRLIVSGCGQVQTRVSRLARCSEHPDCLRATADRYRFEQLLTVANYLVIGATGDLPTTAIAWAMAAGVPVIAPADYSVAEMLADGLNAILFKAPHRWTQTGLQLCKLYNKPRDLTRITEVARSQAYEVFGLHRCIRQHVQLYENLLADRAPGDAISDPATWAPA